MTRITKNFTLEEFLVSDVAQNRGIPNTPTKEHERNIREVLAPVLQIIRTELGVPVIITSAYRNPEVNRIVGGVPNSDHARGLAADIRTRDRSAFELARFIENLMREGGPLHGKIDQLILETSRGIVHVGVGRRLRGQRLTQRGPAGSPFELGIRP
jgi:hypothetical protein